MRILLLGEFSGLHKNLQIGLREAGHDVDLVSSGDGFKAIHGDIAPPRLSRYRALDKLKFRYDYYNFVKKLSGYDVVQLMNVNVLIGNWFPYSNALSYLRKNNGKVFLLAAGSDAFYWQRSRPLLSYGPFEDVLKYDIKSAESPLNSNKALLFNEYIARNVDGVIPIGYEYTLGYKNLPNIKETIPLPIDVQNIKFQPNTKREKLKVFHGLNRYGFKGTRHVEAAFNSLNTTMSDKLDFQIKGGLPLNEYLKILQESNVVIDQVNSYSYGMNAIYAAAMGKVVLSGAEPECLNELQVQNCPIVNVKPDPNDIEEKVLQVLNGKRNFSDWSEMSRSYVERVHCCNKVAQRYIESWG